MRRTLVLSTLALVLGGAGGFVSGAYADKQPRMKAAMVHLEASLNALEKATPDKGGHRVKAIALVKQAIDEVKEGIAHDNDN